MTTENQLLREALQKIVDQHGQWNNGIWAANIARAALAHPAQSAEGGEGVKRKPTVIHHMPEGEARKLRVVLSDWKPDVNTLELCVVIDDTAPPASQEQAQQPNDRQQHIIECMDAWAKAVDLPTYSELRAGPAQQPSGGEVDDTIARLMQFYDADNLQSLALAQCKHVERLQAKLPRIDMPVFTRVREG